MATRYYGRTYSIILVIVSLVTASPAKFRRASFCNTTEDFDNSSKSFLWSLSDRDPPVFFFGTIHVPYTRVWDYLPDNVKQAFQQSDNVFFELDLLDPYTIAALANCQMLPSGESLSDVLPDDMYQRLKRHLDYVKDMMPSWLTADQRGRGLYADYLFNAITGNWERKRPIWVMLMVNSLTESDIKTRGIPVLDLYLAQEAQRMEKRTGAVEKVEEQCVPLNGLNFTQVLFALNQTLVQQENMRSGDPYPGYTTDDLIKHYNCGDLDSVYLSKESVQVPQIWNSSFPGQDTVLARNIDQYFKNELVHKRNVRMGERVLELLDTYPDESFFFAFGAGHFLGNNTVLDYVQSQGFKVEQVPVNKKMRSSRKQQHFRHRHKGHRTIPDPQRSFSWDEEIVLPPHHRNGRRRYRKRQNQHYHGVQLLRTSTTTPGLTFSKPHQRAFNDLWIKIDAFTRPASRYIKPTESTSKATDFQNTLRTWYGLPNSAQQSHSSSFLWAVCVILCFWVECHRTR